MYFLISALETDFHGAQGAQGAQSFHGVHGSHGFQGSHLSHFTGSGMSGFMIETNSSSLG